MTFIAFLIAFIVLVIVGLIHYYRPWIDVTSEGDVLLWYNYHYYNQPNSKWFVSRQCVILFNIKNTSDNV